MDGDPYYLLRVGTFASKASIGAVLCAGVGVPITSVASAQTRVELRIVARENDPAPGLPGLTIQDLVSEGPAIGAGGHVAFRGRATSSQYSLWSGVPGGVQLVAHEGSQASGLPSGVVYDTPREDVSVDAQGRIGFWSSVRGTGVPSGQWAAFWGAPGAISSLLREDSEVPWISPGVVAREYLEPPFLGGGTAVLSANTSSNTGNGSVGIWQTTPTGLQLIMRQGASAPGMPIGAVFDGINGTPYRPLINANGDVAFLAAVTGGGVDYLSNDRGIWIRRNGALSLAFRANSPVSGFGTGVTLRYPDLRAFANDGGVAFFGNLFQNNLAVSSGQTLWWGKPGDMRSVARIKSQAPGAPVGVFYDSFTFADPMLAGEFIGYVARLGGGGVTSSNDYAYFVGQRDNVTMVLREGDQVPGMAPGVVFTDLFDRFAMNSRGQIVFQATIAGPGITTANDTGIWARDTRGNVIQIARQSVPLNAIAVDGSTATLNFTSARVRVDSGGEDGRPTSINAAGQIAFLSTSVPAPGVAAIIRADIVEPCIGDFNADGFLDFADFDDFVGAFEGGLASSDITGDGFLTFDDFDAFVAAFEAGC